MDFILIVVAIFILSALSYLVLLTINNVIWGYKGLPTSKESQIYKKRKRSIKIISIPICIIIIILIGMGRSNDNNIDPSFDLKDQIKFLANKSGSSAANFQNVINTLDNIRDVSEISKINRAIITLEKVQLLFYQANEDSDALSGYINNHKIELRKEGLNVFIDMEGLIGETYFSHRKALREYLNDYMVMLEYSRDNFEAIIQGLQPQSNTYNRLYLKYRTALDIHNEAYFKHMKFAGQYSKQHPKLAEFIEKVRQEISEK